MDLYVNRSTGGTAGSNSGRTGAGDPQAVPHQMHAPLMTSLFEATDVGLMLLDEAGAVLTTNGAALNDFGYDLADLVGVEISMLAPGLIDDFGTGFSSLQRLGLANLSTLKIDRTFVSLLPGGARDQSLITGLLDLARGLNMHTIPEGIETREQLESPRALGCRYGQGYWYARPMPRGDLCAWISARRECGGNVP